MTIVDISDAAVERGIATDRGRPGPPGQEGKLSADDKAAARPRMQGSTDYAALKDVDLVVEAATENLELKLKHPQAAERTVSAKAR